MYEHTKEVLHAHSKARFTSKGPFCGQQLCPVTANKADYDRSSLSKPTSSTLKFQKILTLNAKKTHHIIQLVIISAELKLPIMYCSRPLGETAVHHLIKGSVAVFTLQINNDGFLNPAHVPVLTPADWDDAKMNINGIRLQASQADQLCQRIARGR